MTIRENFKVQHLKQIIVSNDFSIVFLGTPDFAVASLQHLYEKGITIKAVVTAPDRPAGRGKKIHESAVKQYAIAQKLPVLQPSNLKDSDFIAELDSIKADLYVVVAFRMLPEIVWKLPKIGTINLHASLLPQYRGAAPINWAIINGEQKTGNTTFFINEKIDTGDLLLQREESITPEDNAGTLHDKLMLSGAQLLYETVTLIEKGQLQPSPQIINKDIPLKEAPKIYKETCKINWQQEAKKIQNFIRGLSPFPGAWAILNQNNQELKVKIFKTHINKEIIDSKNFIIQDFNLYIKCRDYYIAIDEIQLPGKKRLKTADLLRGFKFEENAYFS